MGKGIRENVSPRKYQITEINDIIAKVPGWKKLKSPRNFEGYGKQRGFKKRCYKLRMKRLQTFLSLFQYHGKNRWKYHLIESLKKNVADFVVRL